MFIGIDYGAKKAGTTALCFLDNDKLKVVCSDKNKDADKFICDHIDQLHADQIFIDAPLSLPSAYFGKGNDFHFRECDRLAKAMSPMFLGGLTARALSLKKQYSKILFFEAYPKLVCNELYLIEKYKIDLEFFVKKMAEILPYKLSRTDFNWHEIDAILAWMVGYRYSKKEVKTFGNKQEGLIYY